MLDILSNEKSKGFSCLDLGIGALSVEEVESRLDDEQIISELQEIADYTFTSPLVDEKGSALSPTQSKYTIEIRDLCEISENKFVVLFLTTQELRAELSFVPAVQAGGGWWGDSHMAIVENGKAKIYERFPFTANHIVLPKENDQDVLLRISEYYNYD